MRTIESNPLKTFPSVAPLDSSIGPGPGRMTECAGESIPAGGAPAAGPARQDQAGYDRDHQVVQDTLEPGSPLLVFNDISGHENNNLQNRNVEEYKFQSGNQKQGKRLYCALESGMKWHQNDTVRFLTVTSSNDSPRDIQYSFNRLIKKIRRTTPADLIDFGYLDPKDASRFYDELTKPLRIEYLSLQTSEGNGVIHALTVGDFLPYRWLSETWTRIHKAWNIDIRAPKKQGQNYYFGRYMLKQYVQGQKGTIRTSCSGNWLYPGWRDDLKALVATQKQLHGESVGYVQAIAMWDKCMWLRKRPSDLYRSATLSDWGLYQDLDHLDYSHENYRLFKANLEKLHEK